MNLVTMILLLTLLRKLKQNSTITPPTLIIHELLHSATSKRIKEAL